MFGEHVGTVSTRFCTGPGTEAEPETGTVGTGFSRNPKEEPEQSELFKTFF